MIPDYTIDPGTIQSIREAAEALLEKIAQDRNKCWLHSEFRDLTDTLRDGDTQDMLWSVDEMLMALGRQQFSPAYGETHVAESHGLDAEYAALHAARERLVC